MIGKKGAMATAIAWGFSEERAALSCQTGNCRRIVAVTSESQGVTAVKTTMIVLLMLAAAVPSNARTPTQSEMHATLMTTNELYRLCSIAQRITSRNAARPDEVLLNGTESEREAANKCWGYVMGVIDSTPIDKSFSPPEERRLSEWVDIVVAYLKANTDKWNQPAFFLVRKAISRK